MAHIESDKSGSLLGHRIHRMIHDPSNAYTGQSIKIGQATLPLESTVGGLGDGNEVLMQVFTKP